MIVFGSDNIGENAFKLAGIHIGPFAQVIDEFFFITINKTNPEVFKTYAKRMKDSSICTGGCSATIQR
ncbi:MAG: hypothetical protein IPL69_20405 [Saprospiraceae bacterium]|nr:hypothetical protein [Candidatus Brachybacter algidus]